MMQRASQTQLSAGRRGPCAVSRPTAVSRQRVVPSAKFSSDERNAKKALDENLDTAKRVAGVDTGDSRRTLLTVAGAAALLTVVAKIASSGKRTAREPAMQVANTNPRLSDNPVANDAKAVLDASKADALAQNVNNTITKDVNAVGIKRMEVPQGRFVPPDLSTTQGNENFGAASLRRSGIERPDSSRNAVQRFTDATNRNIQENVIKGSKPPFAK